MKDATYGPNTNYTKVNEGGIVKLSSEAGAEEYLTVMPTTLTDTDDVENARRVTTAPDLKGAPPRGKSLLR